MLAEIAGGDVCASIEPVAADGAPVSDAEFADLLDAFSGAATAAPVAAEPGGLGPQHGLLDALAQAQARLAARVGQDRELASIADELDRLITALGADAPASVDRPSTGAEG